MKKESEHDIQVALIDWFDTTYPDLSGRLAAVPNAAKVPPWVGKKMNREGRRKGFPDLILLTPRHGCHGLVIELKTNTGRPTKEQLDWLNWLAEQGYCAMLCRGLVSAMNTIDEYLA